MPNPSDAPDAERRSARSRRAWSWRGRGEDDAVEAAAPSPLPAPDIPAEDADRPPVPAVDADSSAPSSGPDEAERADPDGEPVDEGGPAVHEVLAAWREELALLGGRTTLVDDRPGAPGGADVAVLDIAAAHPSGLAQFWAGRPTRLSSLFREPGVHAEARQRARALRTAAAEVAEEHGVDPCALAVGLVRWQAPAARGNEAVDVHAPALLQSLRLRARGVGQLDEDLELSASVRLNPELVRLLVERGYALDARAVLEPFGDGMGDTHRRALRVLRELTAGVPGLRVTDRAVVGLFLDLAPSLVADATALREQLASSPLVRAIATTTAGGPRPAVAVAPAALPWGPPGAVVLDLDPDQQGVLDAVAQGRSVRVEARPGTGATQLVAQVLASAAAAGRRSLLVASQRQEVTDVVARLGQRGLDALVGGRARGAEGAEPAQAGPVVDGDDPAEMVRRATESLRAGHRALHELAPGLGVSGQEVLHRLAHLAALPEVPRSPVRLADRDVRAVAAEGVPRVVGLVREAARLGAFDRALLDSPWYRAALQTSGEASKALARAQRMAGTTLPVLRGRLRELTDRTGLAEPRTLEGAEERLRLLVDVRSTLDVFLPAVYERSLEDLIGALAPESPWRARRRAQREASELVRPGHRTGNLYGALLQADAERRAWADAAVDGGLPRVPRGIGDAQRALAEMTAEVDALEPVLSPTPAGAHLGAVDLEALGARLLALAEDPDARSVLPRRVDVLVHLASLGLAPLVAELAERCVDEETAGLEAEHVWWSSALDAMLEGLGGHWLDELAPGRADEARAALQAGLDGLARADARRLVDSLPAEPVVRCASPLTVPRLLAQDLRPGADGAADGPADPPVDVVVLAGAHGAGLAESVLTLVRGAQVVVVGDPAGPGPAAGVIGSGAVERSVAARTSAWEATEGLLEEHVLHHQHRMPRDLAPVVAAAREQAVQTSTDGREVVQHTVPAPPGARPVVRDLVAAGTGRPDDEGVVHSPQAEVDRVVAVVADHARTSPERSLAVLAATREHARRIADALRVELAAHPALADVLARRGPEPFVVTDLTRSEGCVRDVVVLTTALGRAGQGRAPSGFGPLDAPGGEKALACAVSRARRRLHVVTCLTAHDLAPDRLRTPGARALHDLLAAVEVAAHADVGVGGAQAEGAQADGAVDVTRGSDAARRVAADDPVLATLVQRLAGEGATVDAACEPGDPDLVVRAGGGSVAVLGDVGALDPLRRTGQARGLRQQGWSVVHVGSLEMHQDVEAVTARVLGAVRRP